MGGPTAYRWLGVLAACAVCVFAGAYLMVLHDSHSGFIHDDAYISLRYARHLASGEGLVWNPGEAVEGYTSFAAVVAIGGLGAAGVPLVTAALAVNLLGIALLVGATLCCAIRFRPAGEWGPVAVALPVCIAVTNKDLWVWTYGRLEAPLVAGCVAIALVATLRALHRPGDRRRLVVAALAVGLLPLVRPEGGWVVAVATAAVVAALWRRPERGRRIALFVALAVAPAVAHLLFRLAYYGDVLPNTVWAKAIGVPSMRGAGGLGYVAGYLGKPPFAAAAALALAPFALARPALRLPALLLATCLVGYLVMVAVAGGDHMVGHRLLIPALAPAVLLLSLGLRGLAEALARRRAAVSRAVAVALATGVVLAMATQRTARADTPDPAAYVGTIVGRYLAAHYESGTLVAVNAAGSIPFYAPALRFIDMLGLSDPHIGHRRIDRARLYWQRIPGHAKGDGAYVLSRDPEVIILGPAEGAPSDEPWFLGDLELHESERFHRRYAMRRVAIPVGDLPDHERYRATATGTLELVFYERVAGAE